MADRRSSGENSWSRFLLIWGLAILFLGAVGCSVLYKYLGVYEITRPEPVVEVYLSNTDTEAMLNEARSNIPFQLTEYEDPDELYSTYLDTIDTTRSLTYSIDSKSSTADTLVYSVRSGPSMICQLILSPDGDSPGFGRHAWHVSEVCAAPLTEILQSVTVTVDTVTGVELNLNGKPLSDAYLTGEQIPIANLTRFESVLDPAPCFNRYVVGPLYGDISLADAYGNTLSPVSTESEAVHYEAAAATQSLKIRAPENLKVCINGVELKQEDVSSSTLGVLEDLELYTLGGEEITNTYLVEGLFTIPTVTAYESDGTEVKPVATAENSLTFFHGSDPELQELHTVDVEKFFSAYMDYSAHAFDATRFYNLLSRVFPNSSLYNYIFNSREAMYWASGTSTEYKDLRYENFHRISDYCFVCTVVYSADMTATSWYEQYSYSLENAYELSFITQNGMWYAAGMDVISGS